MYIANIKYPNAVLSVSRRTKRCLCDYHEENSITPLSSWFIFLCVSNGEELDAGYDLGFYGKRDSDVDPDDKDGGSTEASVRRHDGDAGDNHHSSDESYQYSDDLESYSDESEPEGGAAQPEAGEWCHHMLLKKAAFKDSETETEEGASTTSVNIVNLKICGFLSFAWDDETVLIIRNICLLFFSL